jgi:hypothetical protein
MLIEIKPSHVTVYPLCLQNFIHDRLSPSPEEETLFIV